MWKPRIGLEAFALSLSIAGGAAAAEPNELRLGTSTQGGGFSLFGGNLAAVVNATDPSLRVRPTATKGSRENLGRLRDGDLDVALVEGNAAREAFEATNNEIRGLAVLWVMYPNPGMFVVRGDAPFWTIQDLLGQPIAFGTRASGLRILARDVLDGLGFTPENDFRPIILERAAQGPDLVLKGEAAALWGAGIGWPGFVKVAESEWGARFIAPDAKQIARIRAKYPHLRPMTVPAGSYPGQAAPIDSVGLWALVLTRPGLPEATGYRLARALHRGEAALAERLAQGRFATLANTASEVPRERLHPGVRRYLKEAMP